MEEKNTILIVDDMEINIDILLEILSIDYDVTVALDGKTALDIVKNQKIDLILLDIMMPQMDGFEVCRILKEDRDSKDIPIIFITGKRDEESIQMAFDLGGMDYIPKPFNVRELLARVKTQLKIKNLICDLEFLSSYDCMTGIYNRRKFFELSQERFLNSKENLYAVMIDIDKFKNVNDEFGHHVGDKVIKRVVEIVKENILPDAIMGRVGGEEFAIVCNCESKDKIIKTLEKIRALIEEDKVFASNGKEVTFTISNGVTMYNNSIKDLDELLKRADELLYCAKEGGRNRVIFR